MDGLSRAKSKVRELLRRMGYDVVPAQSAWPGDFSKDEIALCQEVSAYTMTSVEAVVTLSAAVKHTTRAGVPGAFVECGVWKGGSMMAIARTLLNLGRNDAHLHLFDTFEGMTAPTEHDLNRDGVSAQELLDDEQNQHDSLLWARAPLEAVRDAVTSVGYPESLVHLVQGRVEETLPMQAPDQIALLRLDTDWYESTRHELTHLYPRLEPGGVLIIDDYGWWRGARKATDEYFANHDQPPFLVRIDDSGRRMAVKPMP